MKRCEHCGTVNFTKPDNPRWPCEKCGKPLIRAEGEPPRMGAAAHVPVGRGTQPLTPPKRVPYDDEENR